MNLWCQVTKYCISEKKGDNFLKSLIKNMGHGIIKPSKKLILPGDMVYVKSSSIAEWTISAAETPASAHTINLIIISTEKMHFQ